MNHITTSCSPAAATIATREQFFKKHITQQKESGLSRSAYCRNHELNYDHFNYWYRKENQSVRQLVPVTLNYAAEPSSFSTIAAPVLCTLTLKNGGVLQVHDKGIVSLILSTLN